jgi:hypothetical protein
MLWDLRAPTRWSARRQRNTLDPAARVDVAAGGARGGGGVAAARTQLRRSVTALAFLPGGASLAAGSDMDGVVRIWDTRMLPAGPAAQLQLPAAGVGGAAAATPPTRAGARRGLGTPGSAARGSAGKGRGGGQAAPWMSVTCPQRGARPHGVTSLALSPLGAAGRAAAGRPLWIQCKTGFAGLAGPSTAESL